MCIVSLNVTISFIQTIRRHTLYSIATSWPNSSKCIIFITKQINWRRMDWFFFLRSLVVSFNSGHSLILVVILLFSPTTLYHRMAITVIWFCLLLFHPLFTRKHFIILWLFGKNWKTAHVYFSWHHVNKLEYRGILITTTFICSWCKSDIEDYSFFVENNVSYSSNLFSKIIISRIIFCYKEPHKQTLFSNDIENWLGIRTKIYFFCIVLIRIRHRGSGWLGQGWYFQFLCIHVMHATYLFEMKIL